MAVHRMETDVLVVGAGPVGLMLAGELRLGGAEVVVWEQRHTPAAECRASILHARTMEILDSRGLLDALGTPPRQERGHFGGIPLDLVSLCRLTHPSPYAGQWQVPQHRTEQLLEAWAAGLGARVRNGHRLRALRVTDTGAEAVAEGPGGPVRARARYVVGCDGERSTVRRLTGADFPGQDARREVLRADVAGIDVPERFMERGPRGMAAAARRAGGVTRVLVHEYGAPARPRPDAPGFAEVCGAWQRVTGEDISDGTPLWVTCFGDAGRQLTRYRHGSVLFAGDAAHQQMPLAGQSLNLGLQDAVNLGWKLAAVVTGAAPEDLLETYHAERRTVGQLVLASVETQAHLLLGGADAEPLRVLAAEMLRLPDVAARLAAALCGLDVRYDTGPGGHPLLGAHLPHAAVVTAGGRRVTTAALLREGRGVLLDLSGGDGRRLRELAAPWSDRVRHVAARAVAGGDAGAAALASLDAALVRPDGHLAWAEPGAVPLRQALSRWFGPSRDRAGAALSG